MKGTFRGGGSPLTMSFNIQWPSSLVNLVQSVSCGAENQIDDTCGKNAGEGGELAERRQRNTQNNFPVLYSPKESIQVNIPREDTIWRSKLRIHF